MIILTPEQWKVLSKYVKESIKYIPIQLDYESKCGEKNVATLARKASIIVRRMDKRQ